ncbi:MAG: hypothetical protein A2808_03505 [Candidatus Moranbacteria bacterium RIFCSPHIGHO2_01_FULL_55_24]|nr:MAG: hypothetical protein A2808_03505 [Candidatus Moranbacteria bacterium RIFCSPHIGHO2_01_FULL_55_24]
MIFGKVTLFAVAVSILILPNIAKAENPASQASQVPTLEDYYYAEDPFLLEWTFKERAKEISQMKEELTVEEKTLARWKEKQNHLWSNLPQNAFTINASAYTAAADECGKSDGITASGLKVAKDRTLACPPNYPFGTIVRIEGMGDYRCEDRGGAIKGNKFDIYMVTKAEAFQFGRKNLVAEVIR